VKPSRWDLVLDQKPRPLTEHLADEVAELFARDLQTWPPPFEELDPALRQGLEGREVAPSLVLYAEAFKLAALDLEREVDAVDDYYRNRRYLEAGLGPDDRGLLQLISRFLVEQLLALGEATEGRFRRPQLLEVLARTRRRFLGRRGPPEGAVASGPQGG
jgi:hypothetical protein